MLISTATQRNWDRLHSTEENRLISRANKSKSQKRVAPNSYVNIDGLTSFAQRVTEMNESKFDIIFSLCYQKLSLPALQGNPNIKRFVEEYGRNEPVYIDIPRNLLESDSDIDWIGYIYQYITEEGIRNLEGRYYTNYNIVKTMLDGIDLSDGRTLFDPCCGGGAFLLNAQNGSLSQLYGTDADEIAVMITKANLIAKYHNDYIYPRIFCLDFLLDSDIFNSNELEGYSFDLIYTNPPWGVCKINKYASKNIYSNERSSLFLEKAYRFLRPGGELHFLLPSSLLRVSIHKDIRNFILTKSEIRSICIYKEKFNGVFTDFFSLKLTKRDAPKIQRYIVNQDHIITDVTCNSFGNDAIISINDSMADAIIDKMTRMKYDDLSHSIWALGIVTGDNKNKIKHTPFSGCEIIYTGKDISKYKLKGASSYLLYDREQLQQCAKDEIYRNREKLVYKFISKNLCFAYDNSGSLFLNSANILIPSVSGMSIKTVLAFLNSELFSFFYSKRFADIKILRGNLESLPFPKISSIDDSVLSGFVTDILGGDMNAASRIDKYIYQLYDIDKQTYNYIKTALYGSVN